MKNNYSVLNDDENFALISENIMRVISEKPEYLFLKEKLESEDENTVCIAEDRIVNAVLSSAAVTHTTDIESEDVEKNALTILLTDNHIRPYLESIRNEIEENIKMNFEECGYSVIGLTTRNGKKYVLYGFNVVAFSNIIPLIRKTRKEVVNALKMCEKYYVTAVDEHGPYGKYIEITEEESKLFAEIGEEEYKDSIKNILNKTEAFAEELFE